LHPRIPLRYLIDPAIARELTSHTVRTIFRDSERVVDAEPDDAATPLERLRQPYLHARVGDDEIHLRLFTIPKEGDTPDDIAVGKLLVRPPAARHRVGALTPRIFPVNVLVQLQPQKGRVVRAVIGIRNGHVAAQRMRYRIQHAVDRVIYTVGPVLFAWRTAGAPVYG